MVDFLKSEKIAAITEFFGPLLRRDQRPKNSIISDIELESDGTITQVRPDPYIMMGDKLLVFRSNKLHINDEQEDFFRFVDIDIERRPRSFLLKRIQHNYLFTWYCPNYRKCEYYIQYRYPSKCEDSLALDESDTIDETIAKIREFNVDHGIVDADLEKRIAEYLETREHVLVSRALKFLIGEDVEVQQVLDTLVDKGNSVALALLNIIHENDKRRYRKNLI